MMRRRSPEEIVSRLRQEARNLVLWAREPALPEGADEAAAPFPDPNVAVKSLRGTHTGESIIAWADGILEHRFPLLGLLIETGPEIRWRRDYLSGKETTTAHFRTIPYLDPARAGDHKIIWELNRHQHLVLLAQAYLLTGRTDFLAEIERQLESWHEANPFQRGINWASALEVAFRALSWMWIDHLVGGSMQRAGRRRLIEGLYRHGLHLEANLSEYFSPNTHLLGEAVALHALGLMFRVEKWEETGARVVSREMQRQVREDGSHFEQSSYYHVYALDMFLFHAVLSTHRVQRSAAAPAASRRPSEIYRRKLERMAQYLEALLGPSRSLPLIGDDDGGRFFHPFGPRDRFGRATLAACGCFLDIPRWIAEEQDLHEYAAWWLGGPAFPARREARPSSGGSECFADAGTVVMRAGAAHCVIDAGPFGPFRAGHSHADTLSLVARSGAHHLLIDPGTFTYAADSRWRGFFRGTAAHNTVRVGGLDQADPDGPFGWSHPPGVVLDRWNTDRSADFVDAACLYRGFRHRRRVLFLKPELVFILDDIGLEGLAPGQIDAEQFWHPGGPIHMLTPGCFRIADAGMLVLAIQGGPVELSEGGEFGWRSPAYGLKQPSPLVVCRRKGWEAVRFGTVVAFSAASRSCELALATDGESVQLILTGERQARVTFPARGIPHGEVGGVVT